MSSSRAGVVLCSSSQDDEVLFCVCPEAPFTSLTDRYETPKDSLSSKTCYLELCNISEARK